MDRKWWTLIAVCVGTFMLLLDVTIVNVALPAIQSSLKASFSDLQWVVDAYALSLAALLLTTGSLADLFGRRRVFVIGLAIFSASSLLSGLATTPLWLNLARGAQGVGGAAMFSTSLALLGSAFQGRERGTAFGVWGAITGIAVAIGPVVGGALTTGISWRWIFLVNVPIGVIGIVLCLARVEESKMSEARRPDLIGFVTFSGALGALIFALIKGNSMGWGSTEILSCLIGAAVLMIIFVIAEVVQRDRAMFELSLFRKPTFTGGAIAAFALSAGLFSLFLYLTLYMQDVLGYSALQTGLRFLVLSGGILLTSTLAGRLTTRVPIRLLIGPGLMLVGAGLLLMRGVTASSGWTHLIPGFIAAGAGTGLINPPLASTAIGVVTPDRAGMASGINSTFRQIGIATGIAGLGSLFSHTVRTHIASLLAGTPHVSARAADALGAAVAQGGGARSGLGALPLSARPAAEHAVRSGFVNGLNLVFLVGAILAFVAGVLTLLLIRGQDFETGAARTSAPAQDARAPEPEPEPAAAPEPEPAAMAEPAAVAEPELVGVTEPAPAGPAEPAGAAERETEDALAPERAAEPQPRTSALPAPLPQPQAQLTPRPRLRPSLPAVAVVNGASSFVQGAEALILAAEQAGSDYERQMEEAIARQRAEQIAAADARSRELLTAALERSDRYAAALRGRLAHLLAERDRLVAALRAQVDAAAERVHAAEDTRSQLYRVIGELGSLKTAWPDVLTPGSDGATGNGGGGDGGGGHGHGPSGTVPGRRFEPQRR